MGYKKHEMCVQKHLGELIIKNSGRLVVVFSDPVRSFTKTVTILLTCDFPSNFPVLRP